MPTERHLVVLDGTTGQNALVTGKRVCGGGGSDRHYPDEDGWHGKGWYRCSDTVGA